MKYLDKSFQSPANSEAYRDGWERIFAEKCKRCGAELVDGRCPRATPPTTEDELERSGGESSV